MVAEEVVMEEAAVEVMEEAAVEVMVAVAAAEAAMAGAGRNPSPRNIFTTQHLIFPTLLPQ